MIRAIIFDCFGVVYIDSFDDTYRHFGGDTVADKIFIETLMFNAATDSSIHTRKTAAEHLGVTLDDWKKVADKSNGLNKQLIEYIKVLRKSYRIAMLTNIREHGLDDNLGIGALDGVFEVINESWKIGFAKPEARAYEVAADSVSVRLDECVFVDDRQQYIEGAQHVGMKTILYENFDKFKKELECIL